jgi:hypothetical protein
MTLSRRSMLVAAVATDSRDNLMPEKAISDYGNVLTIIPKT